MANEQFQPEKPAATCGGMPLVTWSVVQSLATGVLGQGSVRWWGGKGVIYRRGQAGISTTGACYELTRPSPFSQQELKLKDKECERLSKVREQLEQELEELTASLFEVPPSSFSHHFLS